MQDELPPEALLALQRGNLIDAIKIVRERTGLGLKEAKEFVERHANGTPPPEPADLDGPWAPMHAGAPRIPPEAIAALAAGHKVEAVKLTREATGLGLAESLKLVDAHMHGGSGRSDAGGQGSPSGMFDPMAEPGRVPPGGSKWLGIAVVLVVLLACVYLFAMR